MTITASGELRAANACAVSSDAAFYQARAEQSILLMQYGDIILRATGGKIRCVEDAANGRQRCSVEGAGEMLVDAPARQVVVTMPGDGMHEVQVYASGDVSCGLASDFN